MILYTPMPTDLLENKEIQNIVKIQLPSGGYIRAETLEYNRIRVIDLVSTDPADYLNASWQPGTLLALKPSL